MNHDRAIDLDDGHRTLRVLFGHERHFWHTGAACSGCGAARGSAHLGCEIERCPRCHGLPLVSCGCATFESLQAVAA